MLNSNTEYLRYYVSLDRSGRRAIKICMYILIMRYVLLMCNVFLLETRGLADSDFTGLFYRPIKIFSPRMLENMYNMKSGFL